MAISIIVFKGVPALPTDADAQGNLLVPDPPQLAADNDLNQGWRVITSGPLLGPLRVEFQVIPGGAGGTLANTLGAIDAPAASDDLYVQYSKDSGSTWVTFEGGVLTSASLSDQSWSVQILETKERASVDKIDHDSDPGTPDIQAHHMLVRFVQRVDLAGNAAPATREDEAMWGVDNITITQGRPDSDVVRHQIPRSDFAYSWIAKSTLTQSLEFYGYESDNYLDNQTLSFLTESQIGSHGYNTNGQFNFIQNLNIITHQGDSNQSQSVVDFSGFAGDPVREPQFGDPFAVPNLALGDVEIILGLNAAWGPENDPDGRAAANFGGQLQALTINTIMEPYNLRNRINDPNGEDFYLHVEVSDQFSSHRWIGLIKSVDLVNLMGVPQHYVLKVAQADVSYTDFAGNAIQAGFELDPKLPATITIRRGIGAHNFNRNESFGKMFGIAENAAATVRQDSFIPVDFAGLNTVLQEPISLLTNTIGHDDLLITNPDYTLYTENFDSTAEGSIPSGLMRSVSDLQYTLTVPSGPHVREPLDAQGVRIPGRTNALILGGYPLVANNPRAVSGLDLKRDAGFASAGSLEDPPFDSDNFILNNPSHFPAFRFVCLDQTFTAPIDLSFEYFSGNSHGAAYGMDLAPDPDSRFFCQVKAGNEPWQTVLEAKFSDLNDPRIEVANILSIDRGQSKLNPLKVRWVTFAPPVSQQLEWEIATAALSNYKALLTVQPQTLGNVAAASIEQDLLNSGFDIADIQNDVVLAELNGNSANFQIQLVGVQNAVNTAQSDKYEEFLNASFQNRDTWGIDNVTVALGTSVKGVGSRSPLVNSSINDPFKTLTQVFSNFEDDGQTYSDVLNPDPFSLDQDGQQILISNNIEASVAGGLLFNSLMHHRSGPYGWASFNQIKGANNPIIRAHRRKNIVSFLGSKAEDSGILKNTIGFTNPANPVSYAIEPIYDVSLPTRIIDVKNSQFSVVYKDSFENKNTYFANESLNLTTGKGRAKVRDILYDQFTYIDFRQRIFPRSDQVGLSMFRTRLNYAVDFWDKTISNRKSSTPTQFLGLSKLYSVWPLDGIMINPDNNPFGVPPSTDATNSPPKAVNFISLIKNDGQSYVDQTSNNPLGASTHDEQFGALQYANRYFFHRERTVQLSLRAKRNSILARMRPGPTMVHHFPTFKTVQQQNYDFSGDDLLSAGSWWKIVNFRINNTVSTPVRAWFDNILVGTQKWTAADDHPIGPMEDTYDEWAKDVKPHSQDSIVVPSFRIASHIDDHLENGTSFLDIDDEQNNQGLSNRFEIPFSKVQLPSGEIETRNSSQEDFYKVYSFTEFIKIFDLLQEGDIEAETRTIKLTATAVKKFLPYEGLYPAQRTAQLASLFTASYFSAISAVGQDANFTYEDQEYDMSWRPWMQTLFSPGIMYNTIKSGIAVDFPVFTGSYDVSPVSPFVVNHKQIGISLSDKNYFLGNPSDSWSDVPTSVGSVDHGRINFLDLANDHAPIGAAMPSAGPQLGYGEVMRSGEMYAYKYFKVHSGADDEEQNYYSGSFPAGHRFALGREQETTGGFHYRVPFEAIIDPDKALPSNLSLKDLGNWHPETSVDVLASFGGASDQRYVLAANNFFAETMNFFLPDGRVTSFRSLADNQKSFGVVRKPKEDYQYKMRLYLLREPEQLAIAASEQNSYGRDMYTALTSIDTPFHSGPRYAKNPFSLTETRQDTFKSFLIDYFDKWEYSKGKKIYEDEYTDGVTGYPDVFLSDAYGFIHMPFTGSVASTVEYFDPTVDKITNGVPNNVPRRPPVLDFVAYMYNVMNAADPTIPNLTEIYSNSTDETAANAARANIQLAINAAVGFLEHGIENTVQALYDLLNGSVIVVDADGGTAIADLGNAIGVTLNGNHDITDANDAQGQPIVAIEALQEHRAGNSDKILRHPAIAFMIQIRNSWNRYYPGGYLANNHVPTDRVIDTNDMYQMIMDRNIFNLNLREYFMKIGEEVTSYQPEEEKFVMYNNKASFGPPCLSIEGWNTFYFPDNAQLATGAEEHISFNLSADTAAYIAENVVDRELWSHGKFVPTTGSLNWYQQSSKAGIIGNMNTMHDDFSYTGFLEPLMSYDFRPYTPPYYEGYAYVDFIFTPEEDKKYTVEEILSRVDTVFYRKRDLVKYKSTRQAREYRVKQYTTGKVDRVTDASGNIIQDHGIGNSIITLLDAPTVGLVAPPNNGIIDTRSDAFFAQLLIDGQAMQANYTSARTKIRDALLGIGNNLPEARRVVALLEFGTLENPAGLYGDADNNGQKDVDANGFVLFDSRETNLAPNDSVWSALASPNIPTWQHVDADGADPLRRLNEQIDEWDADEEGKIRIGAQSTYLTGAALNPATSQLPLAEVLDSMEQNNALKDIGRGNGIEVLRAAIASGQVLNAAMNVIMPNAVAYLANNRLPELAAHQATLLDPNSSGPIIGALNTQPPVLNFVNNLVNSSGADAATGAQPPPQPLRADLEDAGSNITLRLLDTDLSEVRTGDTVEISYGAFVFEDHFNTAIDPAIAGLDDDQDPNTPNVVRRAPGIEGRTLISRIISVNPLEGTITIEHNEDFEEVIINLGLESSRIKITSTAANYTLNEWAHIPRFAGLDYPNPDGFLVNESTWNRLNPEAVKEPIFQAATGGHKIGMRVQDAEGNAFHVPGDPTSTRAAPTPWEDDDGFNYVYYRLGNRLRATDSLNYKGQMHIDSSFNLFGVANVKNFEYDAEGNLERIREDTDEGAQWVISPKFETPMFNFKKWLEKTDSSDTNPHPTYVHGDSILPLGYEMSRLDTVPEPVVGIWHQFGDTPKTGEGVHMAITDVPCDVLNATNALCDLQIFASSLSTPVGVAGSEPADLFTLEDEEGNIEVFTAADADPEPQDVDTGNYSFHGIGTDSAVTVCENIASTINEYSQSFYANAEGNKVRIRTKLVGAAANSSKLNVNSTRFWKTEGKFRGGGNGIPAHGSLAGLVGFPRGRMLQLGKVADSKQVKEAIIAIPLMKSETGSEFVLPLANRGHVERVLQNPASKGDIEARGLSDLPESLVAMVDKLQEYVLPPKLNFIDFPSVDPFLCFVLEFKHNFSKRDLSDIWQNLFPRDSAKVETVNASFEHDLLNFPNFVLDENTRWMVFKVKQKAKKNYFNEMDKTINDFFRFTPRGAILLNVETEQEPVYSYNWPYDYFSLVELVKIDAEVGMTNGNIPTFKEYMKLASEVGSTENSTPADIMRRVENANATQASTQDAHRDAIAAARRGESASQPNPVVRRIIQRDKAGRPYFVDNFGQRVELQVGTMGEYFYFRSRDEDGVDVATGSELGSTRVEVIPIEEI